MERIFEDKEKILIAELIEELEEVITEKNFSWRFGNPQELIEKLKRGERIAYHPWLYDRTIRVGQDFGLNHEMIDSLVAKIFESGYEKKVEEDITSRPKGF